MISTDPPSFPGPYTPHAGHGQTTEAAVYRLRGETFHLPNEGDTHISPSIAPQAGSRIEGRGMRSRTRGHRRGLLACTPRTKCAGSTVPGCQTVRVFIVQLLHTRIPHLVATPVFWAKVSLRCQDSSIPSQTRGIVFAEHFRRRAAGECCRQSFSSLGGSVPAGRSSLGPRL